MSGVYLYCIVPARHLPASSVTGLAGAAVRGLECGRIAGWISDAPARPEPAGDAVRQHHEVVAAALTETVSPVPVRFGEWIADEVSLMAPLRERETEYVRLLQHVAGAAEFGLRLMLRYPAERQVAEGAVVAGAGRAESGRAYMESLARRHAVHGTARERAELVGRTLHAALPGRIRDERCEVAGTGRGVINLVHLIGHDDADLYRHAVRDARREFEDVRLLLTGPWPPYSFVA